MRVAVISAREMAPVLERSRVLNAVRRAVKRLGGSAEKEVLGCCGINLGAAIVVVVEFVLCALGERGAGAGERFRGVFSEEGDGDGAHWETVELWSLEGLVW